MGTRYKVSLFTVFVWGALLPVGARPADNGWVQYSAHYNETVTTKDSAGNVTTKQSTSVEKRAKDGAMMMIHNKAGQAPTARIWQADGHMIELNYGKKQAAIIRQSPRKHLGTPGGSPIGAETIGGISRTHGEW